MTVEKLIEKLKQMPQDAVVGCEADDKDGFGCYFKEYKTCSKSQPYDGNLVFLY